MLLYRTGPVLTACMGRYAWPPHQIMTWVGLERYGYMEDAQRLAYRFLYMCVAPLTSARAPILTSDVG